MATGSNYGSYDNYDFNTAGNDISYVAPHHASGAKYLKDSTMPYAKSILSHISAREIMEGALDHYTPEELLHEILLAYTDQPEVIVKAAGKTPDEIRALNSTNSRQSGKRWKCALDNIVLLGQRNPEVAKMLKAVAEASDKEVDKQRYKDDEQYSIDNDIVLNYYKQNDPEKYAKELRDLNISSMYDYESDKIARMNRASAPNDFSTRIKEEFKDTEYDPAILETKIKKPEAIKFKRAKTEEFHDNPSSSDMQDIYEQVDDILAEVETVDAQIEEQTRKLNALRKRGINEDLTMQSDLLEDSLQELRNKKQILLKQLPLIDEDGNVTYPGLEGEEDDDEVDTDELFKKADDLSRSASERIEALNNKDVDKIISDIHDFKEDATAHKEEVNKQIAESDKQLHDKLAAKQKEDVLASNEDMSDIDIDLSDITGFDGDEDIDIEDTEDMPDIDVDLSDVIGFDDTERNETTKNIVKGITPKYGA